MYDVIVIGSGIGGLTAAGLLAQVGGKRVLVLEKHTEPGGLTHAFRRDGASWDVGVHYIGDLGPGTQARTYFDLLSGGDLRWTRMPEQLDRFLYPGVDFAVPSDPAEYERLLIERYPDEAEGISGYFRDINRAHRWMILGFVSGMVPRVAAPFLRSAQRATAGLATMTTGDYLQAHIRSPELRAVLASAWGDYGLTPAQSSFGIHALITHHYFAGAWFPLGGAPHIARTFERGIEQRGGAVLVAQEAVEIVVKRGRVRGVRVVDRRGPEPIERMYQAPVVISNVGADVTYERLLPTSGKIGALTAPARAEIAALGNGASAVTAYVRLKDDARTLGVSGENYWISSDLDHDGLTSQTDDLMRGTAHRAFVSFPSIKAGDRRFHTAEIITFVDPALFDGWRGTPKGNRGRDYSELKERMADGMLRLVDTGLPGFSDLVEYVEVSTPLTVEHYTSHAHGAFYGLPATPRRLRSKSLGPSTPVKGLYLSGQDAGSLGIVGAMMGGVGAASQALGSRGFPRIQVALKRGPSARPSVLPAQKRPAELVAKTRLTDTVWDLRFAVPGDVDSAPGQFARLHVGDDEWRDYSIAGHGDGQVRFLISTRTGGRGSVFAERSAVGATTLIELPLGTYTLAETQRRPVFVATGTGLTPFLPMFEQLKAEGRLNDATLVFGCRSAADDLTMHADLLPGQVVRCYSRSEAPDGGVAGRVTAALGELDFDPDGTDFYVCGSSAMVADARAVLEARGARHLLIESY